jgi:mRNA-degrading endonuclease RelE of RelBE toxin-antitoxin system
MELNERLWEVNLPKKVIKQKEQLPPEIRSMFYFLLNELKELGPIRHNWPSYGKLETGKNRETHHCHLNKNRPIYVVVWEVLNKKIKLMEVRYVGTHENAPY